MRPINVSLDATTWELAKKKPNFSQWVRDQLRSERNKSETQTKYCRYCNKHHALNEFYDHKCIPFYEHLEKVLEEE